MARKQKDPYARMTCGNCGRTVDFHDYDGSPRNDTDPARVHVIFNPGAPNRRGILCTCGHYTLYITSNDVRGLPKGVAVPESALIASRHYSPKP